MFCPFLDTWLLRHYLLLIQIQLNLLDRVLVAAVHLVTRISVQGPSTTAIAVTLRTKLAPVAGLAEETAFVLIAEGAVQPLVTNTWKQTKYTGHG